MKDSNNTINSNDNKTSKSENIIVFSIMAGIVVLLLAVFGWNSITEWLSRPLIWRNPKDFEITYVGTVYDSFVNQQELHFEVRNETGKYIDEYNLFICFGNSEIEIPSYHSTDLKEGFTDLEIMVDTDGYGSSLFNITEHDLKRLNNNQLKESDFSYKIKYLSSGGKNIIKNSGLIKDIIIIVLSAVLGLAGFGGNIKNKPLRMVLKICALPGVVLAVAVIIVLAIGGGSAGSSKESVDSSIKKRASENYKAAAKLKAGAEMHGDIRSAAQQQKEMDRAMADMISGSNNSLAKDRYKNWATLEAGAKMTGNAREAAKAKSAKESALADIISENKKS